MAAAVWPALSGTRDPLARWTDVVAAHPPVACRGSRLTAPRRRSPPTAPFVANDGFHLPVQTMVIYGALRVGAAGLRRTWPAAAGLAAAGGRCCSPTVIFYGCNRNQLSSYKLCITSEYRRLERGLGPGPGL